MIFPLGISVNNESTFNMRQSQKFLRLAAWRSITILMDKSCKIFWHLLMMCGAPSLSISLSHWKMIIILINWWRGKLALNWWGNFWGVTWQFYLSCPLKLTILYFFVMLLNLLIFSEIFLFLHALKRWQFVMDYL